VQPNDERQIPRFGCGDVQVLSPLAAGQRRQQDPMAEARQREQLGDAVYVSSFNESGDGGGHGKYRGRAPLGPRRHPELLQAAAPADEGPRRSVRHQAVDQPPPFDHRPSGQRLGWLGALTLYVDIPVSLMEHSRNRQPQLYCAAAIATSCSTPDK
jgi:hypothetical protein